MKTTITEFEQTFSIELSPETVEDVSVLARMSLNSTKKLSNVSTTFFRDGKSVSYVYIIKRKKSNGTIEV